MLTAFSEALIYLVCQVKILESPEVTHPNDLSTLICIK